MGNYLYAANSEEDVYEKNVLFLQNKFKTEANVPPEAIVSADVIMKVARLFAINFPDPISGFSVTFNIAEDEEVCITGFHAVWLHLFHAKIGSSKDYKSTSKLGVEVETFRWLVRIDKKIWGVNKELLWFVVAHCNCATLLLDILQTPQVSIIILLPCDFYMKLPISGTFEITLSITLISKFM